MKRHNTQKREKIAFERSKTNRWYEYELNKKYLSQHKREAEVRALTRDLGI